MRHLFQDFSVSTIVAGTVAVLVGYTSSVAIVFQATLALNATPAQTASWLWALGIGMGLTTLGLSLWTRQPVLTAWSTPGAALLATVSGVSMEEAIGAFLVCGALIVVAGASGAFERLMDRIPVSLASALLAGVLTRFGLEAVGSARTAPVLVTAMALAYLAGRRFWPRYAVPGVLLVGIAAAAATGRLQGQAWAGEALLVSPVWTSPRFGLETVVGVALPLFIVTMASQNLPGVAAQRASGYTTPVSASIVATGAATLVLAPWGAFAFNLAAITAAICMGREAHEDPQRRYTAAVVAGVGYLVLGLAAGVVTGLLTAFPRELIAAVAGLALLGTIGGSLQAALKDGADRDAALLTFLVCLSGVSFLGIGAPFWGIVAGGLAIGLLRWRRRG